MMRYRLFASLGMLLGVAVNCDASGDGNGINYAEPQFIGFITQIQLGRGASPLGWIRLESHANKLVHRHTVAITSATEIFVRKDEINHAANFAVFQEKQWVKVWFAGPVRKAYRAEMTARMVVIVDRP